MVNWRPVAAVVVLLVGGVLLFAGIGPLISCFAQATVENNCRPGTVPVVLLTLGGLSFAASSYLLYSEYGDLAMMAGQYGRYRR